MRKIIILHRSNIPASVPLSLTDLANQEDLLKLTFLPSVKHGKTDLVGKC